MIQVDLIPYLYFLSNTPEEELEKCVNEIIDLFAPNLILGISDEMPGYGDISRIPKVAEYIDKG